MEILENVSLKSHNTFGVKARAKQFVELSTVQELIQLLDTHTPELILGGGSNILFRKNIDGLVIKNRLMGKEIVNEDDNSVEVRFGSGENWHECVLWCIEKGYGGIENLSLIPGTVGAAPMQNIGAYGVEIKDVFVSLQAVHLKEHEEQTFSPIECEFGYRDSVFKNTLKGQYFITSVTLRLTKTNHQFNTEYGAIQQTLEKSKVQNLSIKAISDAVIQIRQSKLPDPTQLGNAGSFFKNPVLLKSQFEVLQALHPDMFCYDLPEDYVKIPAGWLIEQCGWKGKQVGNAGTYKNQALVIVNHGRARGDEIWDLARQIQDAVHQKYKILLTPEVNVI